MAVKSGIVTLTSSDYAVGVEITDLPDVGAFMILVSDTVDTGTQSIFLACKSGGKSAVIMRPVTAVGTTPELPTITWASGHRPRLKYVIAPHDEEDREYMVTIVGVGGPEPEPSEQPLR